MGLLRLFFSDRTPLWAKWLFGLLALAYLASPWDGIPDIFLGPGFIDDLIVVPLLLWIGTRFGVDLKSSEKPDHQDRPRRKKVENEARSQRGKQDGPIGERSAGMRRES
ncbi:MAG: DUF1232 domain-containing protein [Planctomycetota bacterium]